jgi:hypothetical protein
MTLELRDSNSCPKLYLYWGNINLNLVKFKGEKISSNCDISAYLGVDFWR